MKKIKIIFTLLILTISLTNFAQLNPIKDLYFYQWYSMPYNLYILSWTKPDTTLTDTLVGYNVYCNNTLYRFWIDTIATHTVPQDTSFGGGYFILFAVGTFIHVTAVYNSTHIESIYNDSAYCTGLMIGMDNFENEKIGIFPNPVNDNSVIHIHSPERQIVYITIVSSSGQLITNKSYFSNEAIIPACNLKLKHGLYLLLIYTDNYCVTKKLIK